MAGFGFGFCWMYRHETWKTHGNDKTQGGF